MVSFDEIGVLPEPGDNVAICSRRLEQGTVVDFAGTTVTLPHTVLEGHRIVARPIAAGEALLSWHTPFARALRDLAIGDYVCTPTSLAAVADRGVEGLPAEPSAEQRAARSVRAGRERPQLRPAGHLGRTARHLPRLPPRAGPGRHAQPRRTAGDQLPHQRLRHRTRQTIRQMRMVLMASCRWRIPRAARRGLRTTCGFCWRRWPGLR